MSQLISIYILIISSTEIPFIRLYDFCSMAQVVIVIRSGSSALDISMEIAQVAKEVHIASRSPKVGVLGNLSSCHNLKLHHMTKVLEIIYI